MRFTTGQHKKVADQTDNLWCIMVAANRNWDWSPIVDPIVIRLSDVCGDIEQTATLEVVLEHAVEDVLANLVAKVNANLKRCGLRVLNAKHIRTRWSGEFGDKLIMRFQVVGHKTRLMEAHHVIRQEVIDDDAAPDAFTALKPTVALGETQQRIQTLPPEQQDMQYV